MQAAMNQPSARERSGSIFVRCWRVRFGPSAKPRGDFHARNNRATDFPARVGAPEMRRLFAGFLAACHALQAANAKLRRGKNFARCEILHRADGTNAVFQKKLTDDRTME